MLTKWVKSNKKSRHRLFIESLASPASRTVYRNNLKLYAQYRKVQTFEDLLKGDPRLLQSQIIDYIVDLKEKGLSGYSINTRINSIKKFYESNDIDLRWKKIKGYIGAKRRIKKDRAYTYEEIRKILDKADERERVGIYLLLSSGMWIGAINTLKIKHLQNIEQYNLYKITVYENEEEEYTTFCTPECKMAIDSYLEYRKLHGERLNDNAPLIREQFDINDEIQAAYPKTLTSDTLKKMVQQVRLRAGIVEKNAIARKKHDVMGPHGFRKAFQTKIINKSVKNR